MQKEQKPQKIPLKGKQEMVVESNEGFNEVASSLARIIAEEELQKPNQILSLEALEARYQKELEESFGLYRKRLENGTFEIINSLTDLAKTDSSMLSEEVLNDLNRLASISHLIHGKEAEIFTGGDVSLQEVAGISSDTMEKLYLAAKHLYDKKKYKESADAFGFLATLNADNYAFWLGLGNSEYLCQNYQNALYALAFAFQANPEDPNCHIISCRCYEELKEYENAVSALDMALYVIGNQENYEDWIPKVESEKTRLSKFFK